MNSSSTARVGRPSSHFGRRVSAGVRGRKRARAKVSWIWRSSRSPGSSGDDGTGRLRLTLAMELIDETVRLERLCVHFVEGGNVIVPLQQRGGVADQAD